MTIVIHAFQRGRYRPGLQAVSPRASRMFARRPASAQRSVMASPEPIAPEQIPLGQRLFDNMFLLLVAGIVIMAVLYTGWGLIEILSLPPAPLP
jgi:hypothetical protein